eukprot:4472596-Pleurochrysis_carterae.AAC.2
MLVRFVDGSYGESGRFRPEPLRSAVSQPSSPGAGQKHMKGAWRISGQTLLLVANLGVRAAPCSGA